MLRKVFRKYLCSVINNMEKVTKGKKAITQKLEQADQTNAAKTTRAETKSPYFSPRRTRNNIKIEYEHPLNKLETAVAESSSRDIPIKDECPKKTKTKPSASSEIVTKSSKSKTLEAENSPKNILKIECEQPLTNTITESSSLDVGEKISKKSKAKQSSSKPDVKSSMTTKGKPESSPIKIGNEQALTKSETKSSSVDVPIEEKTSKKSKSSKTEIKSFKNAKGEPEHSPKNTIKIEQPLTKKETGSSSLDVSIEENTSKKSKAKLSTSDTSKPGLKSSASIKGEPGNSPNNALKIEDDEPLTKSETESSSLDVAIVEKTSNKSKSSKTEIISSKSTKGESENYPENVNKIENEPSLAKSETESSSVDVPIEEKTSNKLEVKRSSSDSSKLEIKSPKSIKWEPENWREIIANLKIMRKSVVAPVDTMGCDKCSDENADDKTQRFHKLVALMLSSQTKDQVTYDAMNRLKSRGLFPQNVIGWSSNELEDLLVPVSFYKNKAKYLQKTAQILIDEYDSDIPNTVENLMKLPGVGPKMAYICMNTAWNAISGIGVDVHVHRISNRLKWVKKPTKKPEKTRAELEDWLPSEHWKDVNSLLVGFGQTICTINPKCEICLNNQICPSAKIATKSTKAKK